MKIVMAILIWIIIVLLAIWGVKSTISLVKEIKNRKLRKMNNEETTTNEQEHVDIDNKENMKGE